MSQPVQLKHQEHILTQSRTSLFELLERENFEQLSPKSFIHFVDNYKRELPVYDLQDFGRLIRLEDIVYRHRAGVEKNLNEVQWLPYTIIENERGQIAVYQRVKYAENEEALAGKHSIGWGGHPTTRDIQYVHPESEIIHMGKTIHETAERELNQEVMLLLGGERVPFTAAVIDMLGLLFQNVPDDPKVVGNYHVAIITKVTLGPGEYLESIPDDEKPEAKFVKWIDKKDLHLLAQDSKYEDWTQLIAAEYAALETVRYGDPAQ